jgi:uncharacterized hydantoinase/oxoprolinase family protein
MTSFSVLIQKIDSPDWTLDRSMGSAKVEDIKAIDELSTLILKIINHIPEKWNRQSFDLIVSSGIADFVTRTCIKLVQS